MITVVRTYFAFFLAVALCCVLATPLSAQDLQPKKTGLPGRTVWALATSGTSSVTTFAATDKGLWRSSDNGTSWTETSLKNIAVYAVKSRDIGRTSTLLVGTDKGVLRSTDGGNTWASPEVTTGTVSTSNIVSLKKVFDIEVVGNVWFAATEKGVYRSNNDGRSWSLVNIDRTADNNEVRGITVDGNTVIVNLWKEGLWRSTNSGNSWTKLMIAGETSLAKSVFIHPVRMWVKQGN
jgi:ligand-binding sensor domain-containing protein